MICELKRNKFNVAFDGETEPKSSAKMLLCIWHYCWALINCMVWVYITDNNIIGEKDSKSDASITASVLSWTQTERKLKPLYGICLAAISWERHRKWRQKSPFSAERDIYFLLLFLLFLLIIISIVTQCNSYWLQFVSNNN